MIYKPSVEVCPERRKMAAGVAVLRWEYASQYIVYGVGNAVFLGQKPSAGRMVLCCAGNGACGAVSRCGDRICFLWYFVM